MVIWSTTSIWHLCDPSVKFCESFQRTVPLFPTHSWLLKWAMNTERWTVQSGDLKEQKSIQRSLVSWSPWPQLHWHFDPTLLFTGVRVLALIKLAHLWNVTTSLAPCDDSQSEPEFFELSLVFHLLISDFLMSDNFGLATFCSGRAHNCYHAPIASPGENRPHLKQKGSSPSRSYFPIFSHQNHIILWLLQWICHSEITFSQFSVPNI